ncbi:MAG TPA: hypothetical protein ENJ79_02085 [Gammaproteobacteria bacterium]|nr:hypothetical protein [Gammaproteobacteria bacterium]
MAKLLWKDSERYPRLTRLGQRFEAALMRLFWWCMARFSPPKASELGARFFAWLGPRSAKHRHVLANLRMVCPECDESRIRSLALGVWRNLGSMLAEYPHLRALVGKTGEPAYEIVWQGISPDHLADGRPRIFVAAHLGNIYFSAAALEKLGVKLGLVYSPLTNSFLDKLVVRYVTGAIESVLISKYNATRAMLKTLRKGHSVGLHVDVRVDGGDLFPLLGTPATTTPAPAFLSVKTGVEIIPIRTERLPGARFRVTLFAPLPSAPEGCSDKEAVRLLTEHMNQVIGGLIREHPDQWMCTKRRWPKPAMRERGAYSG